LDLGRQLAQLIKKEGPIMGKLEQTGSVGICSGKCATDMAEQGALHQMIRQGSAVHHYKILLPSLAVFMDLKRCNQKPAHLFIVIYDHNA
jgi:hypothetical protein